MVRIRRRRVSGKISNNSKGKNARLSIYLCLIFMICFLVAFFVFRGKLDEASEYFKVYDLVEQDKKIHQKNEIKQREENGPNGTNWVEKKAVLKMENESAEPEYKEEDKNYLDRIIKRN